MIIRARPIATWTCRRRRYGRFPILRSIWGYVLNATIDRYAYASLRLLDEPFLRFSAKDQNQSETIALTDHVPVEGRSCDCTKQSIMRSSRHSTMGARWQLT